MFQYWNFLNTREYERKEKLQNLRSKGSRNKFKGGSSTMPIPLDDTSDNSNCDRISGNGEKCYLSNEDPKLPPHISECLKYAKEVSDIFSSTIRLEYTKMKSPNIGKQTEVSDEETVWSQAKRVAKMVAIQNQNLDRLVELVEEKVKKDCPSYDATQIRMIAKRNINSAGKSSFLRGYNFN